MTVRLDISELTAPPRKAWRAPMVILAEQGQQAAKTDSGAPENHSAGSHASSS
jgi:hypothetical protein